MSLLPVYSRRAVCAHGAGTARLVLVNEAPGPDEDAWRIPLYGMQGGILYRFLRGAGIPWALTAGEFKWPKNSATARSTARQPMKRDFLRERQRHILCTNSYDRWPQIRGQPRSFCAPLDRDVLSRKNMLRLRGEIRPVHRHIVVCGRSAYLACIGSELDEPASRERTRLNEREMALLNTRLGGHFEQGWYMGHTRRWTLKKPDTIAVLSDIARAVGWL